MSISRPPSRAAAIPSHSDSSVTREQLELLGRDLADRHRDAASPCQPSTIAPQSIEIRSPSRSIAFGDGMPCTISSFTEVQIVAGKPW